MSCYICALCNIFAPFLTMVTAVQIPPAGTHRQPMKINAMRAVFWQVGMGTQAPQDTAWTPVSRGLLLIGLQECKAQ